MTFWSPRFAAPTLEFQITVTVIIIAIQQFFNNIFIWPSYLYPYNQQGGLAKEDIPYRRYFNSTLKQSKFNTTPVKNTFLGQKLVKIGLIVAKFELNSTQKSILNKAKRLQPLSADNDFWFRTKRKMSSAKEAFEIFEILEILDSLTFFKFSKFMKFLNLLIFLKFLRC